MTNPTKWHVRPAKTQISLGIRPVWSEYRCALSGYVRTQAFFIRTAKTLIRLGRCTGWSESSLGAHAIMLVLSWGGSLMCNIQIASFEIMLSTERQTVQFRPFLEMSNEITANKNVACGFYSDRTGLIAFVSKMKDLQNRTEDDVQHVDRSRLLYANRKSLHPWHFLVITIYCLLNNWYA